MTTIDFAKLTEYIQEELHPDLAPFMGEVNGMTVLRHPLVVTLMPIPGIANRQYQHKKDLLKECRAYIDQIGLYERPFRLDTALDWVGKGGLRGEELKEVLAFVWMDMEGGSDIKDPLIRRTIWAFRKAGYVTDGPEKPTEPIKVYRGGKPTGLAWSSMLDVAQWFATRWTKDLPLPVYSAIAPQEAVLARFTGRGESEVVVDPRKLFDIEEVLLAPPAIPSAP